MPPRGASRSCLAAFCTVFAVCLAFLLAGCHNTYDGASRLVEVYRVAFSGGVPVQGTQLASYGYDGLGRHVRSTYDTDGDGSLADEETEWTPRDFHGRPIGIWRQAKPTTLEPTPCSKPYQLFAYHSTGLRGTGFDAAGGAGGAGGILDCPAVRWRDADGLTSNGLEERTTYLQDFRGDVTALVDSNGPCLRVVAGLA